MAENKERNPIFRRFVKVYWITVILGLVAIGKIIVLQADKERVTKEDIYKEEVLNPIRGSILSYDRKPLAVSIPVYEIRWDATIAGDSIFRNGIDSLSEGLARIFGNKPAKAYKAELTSARKNGKRYKEIGNRSIDYGELEILRELPIFRLGQFKGGFIINKSTERVNPYGQLANRTVGYINADGGGTGIELTYDYRLKGEKGFQTIHRSLGGRWIPVNGAPFKPADDGSDIRTTIDVVIQEAAETELRRQLAMSDVFEGGTAIVMDVKTGAVRGIANMFKRKNGTFDESYNYAISHSTEPGSTLKLASLIALIEDGHISLDTEVDGGDGTWIYGGVKITDTHRGGYGKMTAKEAFEKSSNIAFAKMVTSAYGDDPSTYVSRLHNMKLVEKLNLDIRGEGYAYITSPSDKEWSTSSLASLGYGYALTLTPLHILTFYNAVANGGKMVRPYFIESIEHNGTIEEEHGVSVVSGSICSKNTLSAVRQALRGVVEHGTATICNDPRYQIAGKTGTARIAVNGKYEDANGNRSYQASFAGYYPADDPKYSCIVVLYTGWTRKNFYGATWAAPVFKRIADKIYTMHPEWQPEISAKGHTPPDNPAIASGMASSLDLPLKALPMKDRPKIASSGWLSFTDSGDPQAFRKMTIENNIVPDIKGMGLRDALYLMENEGYRARFSGEGRVVSQDPPPGTPLKKGGTVTMILK